MKMNPLVSVVVPVYNTDKLYLIKCIDSLRRQTLKEIEIILVDDGSTNSCATVCDEYAEKDLRIISLHQDNKGVSVARNLGVQKASGKYITFVDSDDWCDDSVLQMVSDVAEKKDAEITLFGGTINRIGRNGKETACEVRLNLDDVKEKDYLYSACCFPRNHKDDFVLATYSKLYKRDFLLKNEIEFPRNVIYGEDRIFALRAFCCCRCFAYCNNCGYHYRINNQNQTTSRYLSKLTASMELFVSLMDSLIRKNCLIGKYTTLFNTNNIIVLFEAVFPQVFFHPDNPCDWGKRFESFIAYMETSFVREILKAEIYPEYLRKSHKVALWLCRKHMYWPFRFVELKWNIQRKIGCWK
ncbi:glycosyltransferase [uncultured Fibrobacter sp.]|uniref:glycosyltransferase family 2 protein n=1 Tax=uncultured Fibrobacter sp. TaxID=261512 RepID=UPI0025F7417B|nr:glycosyltransferase [uncultured Fibrobacter sp.]